MELSVGIQDHIEGRLFGGSSTRETVARIMVEVFSNDLAIQYNMNGQKEQILFGKFHIANMHNHRIKMSISRNKHISPVPLPYLQYAPNGTLSLKENHIIDRSTCIKDKVNLCILLEQPCVFWKSSQWKILRLLMFRMQLEWCSLSVNVNDKDGTNDECSIVGKTCANRPKTSFLFETPPALTWGESHAPNRGESRAICR